jgi:hypothetical protein
MRRDIRLQPGRALWFWPDWLLTLVECLAKFLILLLLFAFC